MGQTDTAQGGASGSGHLDTEAYAALHWQAQVTARARGVTAQEAKAHADDVVRELMRVLQKDDPARR